MLRVLKSLIGIAEIKAPPKRSSPLLSLRLAVPSQPVKAPAQPELPEKTFVAPVQNQKTEKVVVPNIAANTIPKTEKHHVTTAKQAGRMPSETSIQDAVSISAIGTFWNQSRYEKTETFQDKKIYTSLLIEDDERFLYHPR